MTELLGRPEPIEPTDGWAVEVPTGYRVGRWEVTAPIATGSWGSVYAAGAAGPGEAASTSAVPVALKFLPTGTATPRMLDHLARIVRNECRRYELLDHPYLVETFEVLTVDDPAHPVLDGCAVLVMERAERSLADVVQTAPLSPPQAAEILAQLAEGLAHMHAQDWVHGDLKPSNVLVMTDGSIRLADFGMATQLDGTHGYAPPLGSLDYQPPDHRAGVLSPAGLATRPTADVWALGITAHEVLTGRHPFPGATAWDRAAAADAYAAGRARLCLDAQLPDEWRAVISDCLSADPAVRAQHSAWELAGRFRAAGSAVKVTDAATGQVQGGMAGAVGRRMGRRPGVRVRWVVAVGGLVAATAAVASSVLLLGGAGGTASPTARPAQHHPLLNETAGIPVQYRSLIISAGTTCPQRPAVTPALVAAILKVESNFDADLSDPQNDEFGIARWTPRVLRYYLPQGQQASIPKPPFPPEMSIPAVGRFLCYLDTDVDVRLPGDRGGLLAAAYRMSSGRVNEAGGVPATLRVHVDKVISYRNLYLPPTGA